jgi:hypothetical protein
MRKINYEEWKKRKPELIAKLVKTENTFQGHAPGNRPRDPEKERILTEMDKARKARYIASGKLTIIGPRKFKWRIGE